MKKLADYKNRKRKSRPIIEVVPMIFDNNQATHRLVLHHVKRVIYKHSDELEKLAK